MPVFVGYHHLLHNLLYVLVGGFHIAIHLWSIQRRVVVLDLELRAKFSDHSVVEVGVIVCDDSLGNAIPTDKIIVYEPGDHILGNRGERGCFNPVCEVINGDEDEAMSIGSNRFGLSNDINSPH